MVDLKLSEFLQNKKVKSCRSEFSLRKKRPQILAHEKTRLKKSYGNCSPRSTSFSTAVSMEIYSEKEDKKEFDATDISRRPPSKYSTNASCILT